MSPSLNLKEWFFSDYIDLSVKVCCVKTKVYFCAVPCGYIHSLRESNSIGNFMQGICFVTSMIHNVILKF
jgi:hypothetical protein